jgi:putative ABC transport system permease protein
MIVDFDYLDLYGIKLESGRDFSREMGSDDGNAYIINQAAAKRMGMESPLGMGFGFDEQLGTIVGVVGDYHFESFHKPITPLGIGVREDHGFYYISIRMGDADIKQTLDFIEETWQDFVPAVPLKYSFMDERLEWLYRKDRQMSRSMNYLSLMALFITCLGIFSLISFTLREQRKEIAIRKVLGAPFFRQLFILVRSILFIICLATISGGLLGWYLSGRWLENFSYRFNMQIDIVAIAFIITLVLTLLPIAYRLVRSITTNPVDALRIE